MIKFNRKTYERQNEQSLDFLPQKAICKYKRKSSWTKLQKLLTVVNISINKAKALLLI